jgi:EpsI family protein
MKDVALDQETLEVLKADDTLSRVYQNRSTGDAVDLFIAYFSTQQTGKTPHSPKNCLPGTGWVPSESGFLTINIAGEPSPITVNRYVVSRGQAESLVLYWYEARNRIIASEYRAKLFTIFDSLRDHRSDTSLVRVVDSVVDGDTKRATDSAVAFIQTLFAPLKHYLPA